MALIVEDTEAERLAHTLAAATGESVEDAVRIALAERLARQRHVSARLASIRAIQERVSALPVLDKWSDEEIQGYDNRGLFR